MSLSDEQDLVIALLTLHEELLGKMYDTYAERFKDLKEVWKRLAGAERGHAKMLDGLRSKIKKGELSFNQDRFELEGMRTSLVHLETKVAEASTINTVLEALRTALEFEKGILERRYYKVADGDHPEMRSIFMLLAIDTELHRDEIQKLYNEFSRK